MRTLSSDDVRRILFDLLVSEVCRSRNISSVEFEWQPVDDQLWLDESGLNASSIERLELASASSELFNLFDSPLGDRLLIAKTLDEWTALVIQFASNEQVTFRSSGSTGEPTCHTHSYRDLFDELDGYAEILSESERIISLVPAHHIYGFLWTVLLPNTLGVPALSFKASRAALHQDLQDNDLIVATPVWWEYIDRTGLKFKPGCIGVCSTGPLSGQIRDRLVAKMHEFLEIYGSSETGGIGIRKGLAETYELLPRWQSISAGGDQLFRADNGCAVSLPDHIDSGGERAFRVSGRRDRMVQIAGHNVSPQKVTELLLQCEDIQDISVRMMRPEEGTALKALVVTEQADDLDVRNSIREQVARMLPAHERPQLTFKAEMPRNALGKLVDW